MKNFILLCAIFLLGACSVFGRESVETPSYQSVEKPTESIEIRTYPNMVMAMSAMPDEGDENNRNSAFMNLFRYISGDNAGSEKIAMTAPVLMDKDINKEAGTKIPMTAPVFMNDGMMAFILPSEYTMDTAPQPTAGNVVLKERSLGTVAVITFNGSLDDRATEQTKILQDWIAQSNYTATGDAIRAGYNPPFTLPAFRRNEILIPVAQR